MADNGFTGTVFVKVYVKGDASKAGEIVAAALRKSPDIAANVQLSTWDGHKNDMDRVTFQ